jgi:DNA mismatch repair protein MutL
MCALPRIHVLSDHVANKIAAGEVVDRPASVMKELVENAIDAKATRIDVQVVAGGKRLIAVADNGHGMTRDDALLAIERHATSKIRDVDDIECVATLGFRGEALAAISSVSRFTLITRPADDVAGTEVQINGGKLLDVKETGCPIGTRFEVRNLFFNVPARRKFLRADATELSHLRQTFLVYALSHPDIGMTFMVDDRMVYELADNATLEDRLREIYGRDYTRNLRAVDYRGGDVHVSGMAALAHQHRADRSEQFIFVNGRPASAPTVAFALNEAYHTYVPKGRYPSVYLFLQMSPDLVDVNVHPTKKEVRFRRNDWVRDAVIEGLKRALAVTPDSAGGEPLREGNRTGAAPAPPAPRLNIADLPFMPSFTYPRLPPQEAAREDPASSAAGPGQGTGSHGDEGAAENRADAPWSWCRILGQVGGLYVVMETEDGLVLMDPHAAHERLMFEKFMRETVERKVKSQGLLAPETVDLSPRDAVHVRKHIDLMVAMGFGLSEFGGDTFLVDAMPVCLGGVSATSVLADIAQGFEQSGERGGTERWAEERVAKAACRAAVKANDRLTLQEIERLVVDLAQANMPYTCPHGRPTLIFMGYNELDRKFGRI